MDRKSKTMFQLETPYSEVKWPPISTADQDRILELLISLLSPIGQHRSAEIKRSKGKRSHKRKREDVGIVQEAIAPKPAISAHVVVGINSVNRHLQNLVNNCQHISRITYVSNTEEWHPNKSVQVDYRHLSAVFVTRSSQAAILHAHLSQLVAAASLNNAGSPATRIVQLPKECESIITASLGIPRVGFLAIMEGAPCSATLVDFVREVVPAVEAQWLKEVTQYQAVKINAVETTALFDKGGPKVS